jgi:hypothetical protein
MPFPHYKPLPIETVAMIKAIVNQDRRERRMAGFIRGTRNLAKRIAEQFGLSVHTVMAIKERKRRAKVWARSLGQFQTYTTVAEERLEAIRQQRIRQGVIGEPWRPVSGKLGYSIGGRSRLSSKLPKRLTYPWACGTRRPDRKRQRKDGPDRPETSGAAGPNSSKSRSRRREPRPQVP